MCYLCTLYRVFNICCENSQKSGFLIQFWGITVGLFDPLKLPDFCTVFSFFFPLSLKMWREGCFLFPSLSKMVDEDGFLHTDWVSEFECTDRVSHACIRQHTSASTLRDIQTQTVSLSLISYYTLSFTQSVSVCSNSVITVCVFELCRPLIEV